MIIGYAFSAISFIVLAGTLILVVKDLLRLRDDIDHNVTLMRTEMDRLEDLKRSE